MLQLMPPPTPPHPPGSFTKNFGWEKAGPGLMKLHTLIKNGFGGTLVPLERETFRATSGLTTTEFLIATDFFLFNSIIAGSNYVAVDELVYQALTIPHTSVFDRLLLFALNLSLAGPDLGGTAAVSVAMGERIRKAISMAERKMAACSVGNTRYVLRYPHKGQISAQVCHQLSSYV